MKKITAGLIAIILLHFVSISQAQLTEGTYYTNMKGKQCRREVSQIIISDLLNDKFIAKLVYTNCAPDEFKCKKINENTYTGYYDAQIYFSVKPEWIEVYIYNKDNGEISAVGVMAKVINKVKFKELAKNYASILSTQFVPDTITSEVHKNNLNKFVFYAKSTEAAAMLASQPVTEWNFKDPIYFRYYLDNSISNIVQATYQEKYSGDNVGYNLYLDGTKIATVKISSFASWDYFLKWDPYTVSTNEDYFLALGEKRSNPNEKLILSTLRENYKQYKEGVHTIEIALYIKNAAGESKEIARGSLKTTITAANMTSTMTNYELWGFAKPKMVNKTYEQNISALIKKKYPTAVVSKVFIQSDFVTIYTSLGGTMGRALRVACLMKNDKGECVEQVFDVIQPMVGSSYSANFEIWKEYGINSTVPCTLIDLKK